MKAQKVSTCFWFDREAEAAAEFYISLLPGSRIVARTFYGRHGPLPEGTAMTVTFELCGTVFTALNGGPNFSLSEAASIVVACEDQEEIDRLWAALLQDGGREQQCGWIRDRFGMPWQIVPARLHEMLGQGDRERQERVMTALFDMVKLDIAGLEAAWRGV